MSLDPLLLTELFCGIVSLGTLTISRRGTGASQTFGAEVMGTAEFRTNSDDKRWVAMRQRLLMAEETEIQMRNTTSLELQNSNPRSLRISHFAVQ
jgi:hypothetical protein